MKQLILCADDYAQNDEISTGIRMAYAAGRINAVSCLTNMPDWPEAGDALTKMSSNGLFGLHLNFTFGHALSEAWSSAYGESFQSLPRFIFLNYLRLLKPEVIVAECSAQLKAFRQVMGRSPDFIDGHQHVHQLPMMRQALLDLFTAQQLRAFVRVAISNPLHASLKALIIACLGGFSLRRVLKHANILMNSSFGGVYCFQKSAYYRQFFKQFLVESAHHGLIMCHPGLSSNDQSDPLYASRYDELQYLMSEDFLSDLSSNECVLMNEKIIHE